MSVWRLEARSADGSRLVSGSAPSSAVQAIFRRLAGRGHVVTAVALLAAAPAMASPASLLTEVVPYETLNDAAKAAEAVAMPLSKVYEYGGVLVERNGKFFFTDPVTSGRVGEIKVRALIPAGSHLAALYHTHPGNGCGRLFSREDVETATGMRLPSYIGAVADGSVRLFAPGMPKTPSVCHGAFSAGEVIS
jgi:hypothetical protein